MSLMQFAFTTHVLIETPAAINFMLRPSSTLYTTQEHSHGVIRQYALLLTVTVIVAALVLSRAVHDLFAAQVAGALALHHLGPMMRAASKIRQDRIRGVLGGPWVHLVAHALCAVALVATFFRNQK